MIMRDRKLSESFMGLVKSVYDQKAFVFESMSHFTFILTINGTGVYRNGVWFFLQEYYSEKPGYVEVMRNLRKSNLQFFNIPFTET